ncbi:MAG TPA: hypothetical protein V6C86_07785 [Oculatellaceae cyanobacterium]
MTKYKLRYFFDPGTCICLWTANDRAHEKFGYPVDISKLPLCENTQRRVIYIAAWYDTSIDWSYPADPSPWDVDERRLFNAAAQKLFDKLRTELGDEFELVDESGTSE